MNISAIICAAGMSTRMGHINKLLMKKDNRSFVEHVVSEVLDTDVHEVIVVVGHEERKVREALKPVEEKVRMVVNPSFQQGQTSTIQKGLEQTSDDADAYMICLSDMPLIESKQLMTFMTYFKRHAAHQNIISRPVYREKKGHPVIFHAYFGEDLLNCTDKDGCKSVIQKHGASFVPFEHPSEGFFKDIDTPADLDGLA